MARTRLIFFRAVFVLLMAITFSMTARASETGQCGDQVFYDLNDSGVVHISGTGSMWDFTYGETEADTASPFYALRDRILSVVIGNGVTNIGAYSFSECASLGSVSLPEGLLYVETGAFLGSGLTAIGLPESLRFIMGDAFKACRCLQSVTIPSNVYQIDYTAFLDCDSLSVIEVSENNSHYKAVDGVLFSKSGSVLYKYPQAKAGTYAIPDTVSQIYYYAFYGAKDLTEITIPDNGLSLAPRAFENCTGITSVTVPGSISVIEARDFYGCTNLRTVILGEGIEMIESQAFGEDTALLYLELPASVTHIGTEAFLHCYNLRGILIPASVTQFGERVFNRTTTWLNILGTEGSDAQAYALQNRLTFRAVDGQCGEHVFWAYNPDDGSLVIFGSGAMYEDSDYAGSVHPFKGRTDITSVTFLDGVTRIADNTFFGCTGMTELDLPGSLTQIGASAFRNCSSLRGFYIPEDTRLIDRYAFAGCTSLEKAYFYGEKTVAMAFGTNVYDKTDNLIVYARYGTMAYIDAARRGIKYYLVDPFSRPDLLLPPDLTEIGEEAFAGISASVIDMHDNVKTIGSRAFADNAMLKKIAIPDWVESIAGDAFDGCPSDLIIYGHQNTLAETFAREKGRLFALLPVS